MPKMYDYATVHSKRIHASVIKVRILREGDILDNLGGPNVITSFSCRWKSCFHEISRTEFQGLRYGRLWCGKIYLQRQMQFQRSALGFPMSYHYLWRKYKLAFIRPRNRPMVSNPVPYYSFGVCVVSPKGTLRTVSESYLFLYLLKNLSTLPSRQESLKRIYTVFHTILLNTFKFFFRVKSI